MPEPRVVIVVPRRADRGHRDRLWAFTRKWWTAEFPDWPIIEGHHNDGPFNRSAAINSAVEDAGDFDVVVIIDSDVLCDFDVVRTAVRTAAVQDRMVIAGDIRNDLTRAGTRKIMDGYRGPWKGRQFIERTWEVHWSSCVVVSRKLWDTVGGFDPMFEGWGYEDDAFMLACEAATGVPTVNLHAPIWHLWHERGADRNLLRVNRGRADRYLAARLNWTAIRRLAQEAGRLPADEDTHLLEPLIPRILHRTVPAETSPQVEAWWDRFVELHPGWEHRTWRDPLDPALFPETNDLWPICDSGAQLAGLVRLEVLWHHGGVYVDSDVEPYRSLEPLLACSGFAAWEDDVCVPDAVLGFSPRHMAVRAMLDEARRRITQVDNTDPKHGNGAWSTGPGVSTTVLPNRGDVLLLPPGAFYPYHYTDKKKGRTVNYRTTQPWCFAVHHWAHSWA